MKNVYKIFLALIFLVSIISITSCKGVRIQHGNDCGCGSFGKVEQGESTRQQ